MTRLNPLVLGALAFACATHLTAAPVPTADEIAAALPAHACLPGHDRAGWQALAAHPDAARFIRRAERILAEPIPDTSDDLYLEYGRNGNRTHYQKPYFGRIDQLVVLDVAESLERKGRFIPRLVSLVEAICAMRSWVLPAHDGKGADDFHGRTVHVDLFASQIGSHLAYLVSNLGDALPAETVALIRRECTRRILDPVRASFANLGPDGKFRPKAPQNCHGWICGRSNWTAVCHDNVVTTALGLLDDPRARAVFVFEALRGMRSYALGFEPDGYCSEGMGYWNYGFGHFLMFALTLRDLTGGRIDAVTEPRLRKAAEYAGGYQLERGVSPAFADGTGAPSPANLALVRRIWPDLTCEAAEKVSPFGVQADGVAGAYADHYAALLAFGKTAPAGGTKDAPLPLRTAFPDSQVWLLRAGKDLSVAVKGGHNADMHNHNDVGSYYLVSHGKLLSGDPGAELYTARTFSARRYEGKVLSSYGHPLPVVGGRLQEEGLAYRAEVVRTEFTDARDTVVLELKGAYKVKSLKSLLRTFVFDRAAKTFTVTDRVRFTEPTAFEDAYTTFAGEDLRGKAQGQVHATFAPADVKVEVLKGGAVVESVEHIANPERIEPDRHGIRFAAPVTEAEIAFTFRASSVR